MFQFSETVKARALSKYGHFLTSKTHTPVCIHMKIALDPDPSLVGFKTLNGRRGVQNARHWYGYIFKRELDSSKMQYLVFTEDAKNPTRRLQEIRQEAPQGTRFELIDLDPAASLYLMTQCVHHVLDTTEFGFWGAYLSEHQTDDTPGTVYYSSFFQQMDLGDTLVPPYSNWKFV